MSRISSTFKKNYEPYEHKSAFLTSVPRTRSPSPARKTKGSPLNRSRQSLNESIELKSIENDYIKNLQQQVYFLELEANYLREQAKTATQMHPKMTAEAERMLAKLRNLQNNVDDLNFEVRRKDETLDLLHTEKDHVLTRLEQEEMERQREKRSLNTEIIELRKERERLSLENNRIAHRVDSMSTDKEKLQLELINAEDTVAALRRQLDEKIEHIRMTQITLDETRSQVLQAETHARDVEDRYIKNASILHERTVNDLKDEIRLLRSKLQETEDRANGDRRLRARIEGESADVLQDNSYLQQQINDLQRQLARERELRESGDEKRSRNLAQLSVLSDKEKELQVDIRRLENALREEKNRADRYLNQLSKQEEVSTSLELNNTSNKSKVYEYGGRIKFLESENTQLRKDKELLVDHVAELQRQLSLKSVQLSSNKSAIRNLERDLGDFETERVVDSAIQSQKWQEFENLADSMKSLTRSMAEATSPRSPRASGRRSRKSGKGMYAL